MKILTTTFLLSFLFCAFAQEGWNDVTPAGTYPGLRGIYALDSDNVWVVGEEGKILNTTNSGTTWSEINCPVIYNLYNVHFINADTGWVGGDNNSITEIMGTTDRGLSWELKTLSSASDYGNYDIEFIYGDPSEPPRGFVSAGLSLVWKTDDYGENWVSTGFGSCGANNLQSICFIDKDEGWFVGEPSATSEVSIAWAVGANGNIAYSTDWGYTWTAQQSGVTCELWEVFFVNDDEGWIVGGGVGLPGVILHTTNGGLTFVEDEEQFPLEFSLSQNYPNPFNPATTIKYQFITLKVYDVLGNEVTTLVNEELPAGEYEVEFSINNLQLSSGVYFYQLRVYPADGGAGNYIETKKMILLK